MLSMSGAYFSNSFFPCVGGCFSDIHVSFRCFLDRTFDRFVFLLKTGSSSLDFVELTCRLRYSFSLAVFALLLKPRNSCLNVLDGIEDCVFFVSACDFDALKALLKGVADSRKLASVNHDRIYSCFA